MGDVAEHRGPDDFGWHIDKNLAIGMRRLSIIDVGGGHQPLKTADQKVWVVCNGEIYNFREERAKLEALGHQFLSNSDSEVLLHAYRQYGDQFLDHIDGMFGFALWDASRRRLIVGRDRLGIKPLYVWIDERRFIFASEIKSILSLSDVRPELDKSALSTYLQLGYSSGEKTLFRNVRRVQPGHVITVTGEAIEERCYWRLPAEVTASRSLESWSEELRTSLTDAVRAQLVSDVPLGAFLSGGIDSSAVVAIMADAGSQPVKTYSIGFDSGESAKLYNELPYARQIAERFSTDHHEIVVRPNVAELLPKLIWHMDEPVADSAIITTYLIAEFARRDVTVILSGVGGDELFGGYRRYLGAHYQRLYRRIPAPIRKAILEPLAARLPSDRHTRWMNYSRLAKQFLLTAELGEVESYRSYVGVFADPMLKELLGGSDVPSDDVLGRAFDASRQKDALNRLMEVDFATQLPDDLLLLTDKTTMATSLECRVPLLDTSLVNMAFQMPGGLKVANGQLKHIFKKSLEGLLPKNILNREKRGFGAPVGSWIRNELKPAYELLVSQHLAGRGLFDPKVLDRLLATHGQSKEDFTDHIQALANLEIWIQLFLEGRSHNDLSDELQSVMPVAA